MTDRLSIHSCWFKNRRSYMTSHNSAENMAHANQKHGEKPPETAWCRLTRNTKTSPYPSCANVESCGFADIAPVPKITSVQVTSPLPIGTQISGKGHRDAGSLVAVVVPWLCFVVFWNVSYKWPVASRSIQKHQASPQSHVNKSLFGLLATNFAG